MGLRENAAAAAGRTLTDTPQDDLALPQEYVDQFPAADPMAGYEPGDDDPEMVPVHIAWLRVRREIRAIAKGELYNQSGTRFNFRGVDTVVNVFGPVTLKHGVNVLSSEVAAEYGEKTTKSGSKMRECTALVHWTIMGPMGDTLTLQTRGEALDTADKSTTKAQSVALRTLLLGFGLTPTHDTEPDSERHERGQDPIRPAVSYLDEVCDPKTSAGRLRQIHHELNTSRQLGSLVTNEVGDEERIGDMVVRIGKERAAGGGS
ncbi:ERF family protein [Streptomyces sp. NPDC002812]|uniref:ERF family protein n=1 Tax=Streptomyces sp. NPDC002812 TaxID=3154434 RepID=UPI0033324FC4